MGTAASPPGQRRMTAASPIFLRLISSGLSSFSPRCRCWTPCSGRKICSTPPSPEIQADICITDIFLRGLGDGIRGLLNPTTFIRQSYNPIRTKAEHKNHGLIGTQYSAPNVSFVHRKKFHNGKKEKL